MWRYEDKGARPEGRRRSVWTSAGPHGSRTQAELAINMDVHQAPCPLPPGLPLCAATGCRVPANSISGAVATSGHAKVINKHPQMATHKSQRSRTDTATPVSSRHAPFQWLPKQMQTLPTALEQAEIVTAGGAGVVTAFVQGCTRINKNKMLAVVT